LQQSLAQFAVMIGFFLSDLHDDKTKSDFLSLQRQFILTAET
jgi:hypothetical protein